MQAPCLVNASTPTQDPCLITGLARMFAPLCQERLDSNSTRRLKVNAVGEEFYDRKSLQAKLPETTVRLSAPGLDWSRAVWAALSLFTI